MNNLLKNEFIKVFKKKGFLIMIIIMFAFVFLTNFLYKTLDNVVRNMDDIRYEEFDEDYYKERPELKEDYVEEKTGYEIYELKKKYDKKSWQRNYIETSSDLEQIKRRIVSYELKFTKDEEDYNLAKEEYNQFINKLDSGDWKDVAKDEKKKYEESLEVAEGKEVIEELKIRIEGINLRLEKNISYADSYMNTALNNYIDNKVFFIRYEDADLDKLSKEESFNYYESRKEYFSAKYTLDNNKNLSNEGTEIINIFYNEYLFIIIVMIFMIAGGIASQEFSKGTIKQLLVRPYSRTKILLSKYITSISCIFIACFITFVFQLILGTIFFGTESLTTPIISYSNISDKITVMNIFVYSFKSFLGLLPTFLLLTTLAFAASTIFNNTALSIVISFAGFIGSDVVTELLAGFKKWWIKYIYCFNWNFTPYIFNNKPDIKGVSLGFSIIVCLVYLAILLIPSFIVFKNRDIKNV